MPYKNNMFQISEPQSNESRRLTECKNLLASAKHIHSEDTNHGHVHDHDHDHGVAHSVHDVRLWLAGVTSIIVISLCGIFGVLVVPIMQKVIYSVTTLVDFSQFGQLSNWPKMVKICCNF